MFDALAQALSFFYDLWPSYGGAIALFTLAIMVVLSPLSIKSTRSMIKMQRVQPELKKLQQQYKGDREALNREMMAFYQANNINPFSSCLPMLLQMPVFIVLYQVLAGLTRRGDDGFFNPKYLEQEDNALANALRASKEMLSFGMDLSRSALTELQDVGVIQSVPYFVLIALVAVTAWYQQRQIAGRNPGAMNPQQQMIGKIMPFVFVPITLSIPAGVVIYFVVSNLVRVAQQAVVTKLEYGSGGSEIITPPPTAPPADGSSTKPTKPPKAGKSTGSGRATASGRTTPPSGNRPRNRKRKRK